MPTPVRPQSLRTRLRTVVPGGDGEAGRHSLDVVLEGAGEGLVEVVQVEQQHPFGRREPAEVREVGIPAQLGLQPRRRRVLQIGGHDLGGTPVEGERRHHHPTVTHGDQVWLPREVLFRQQRYRVGPARGRLPTSVTRRGDPSPRRLAPCSALFDAWMGYLRRVSHVPPPVTLHVVCAGPATPGSAPSRLADGRKASDPS